VHFLGGSSSAEPSPSTRSSRVSRPCRWRLTTLDDKDLIQIRDGRVEIATVISRPDTLVVRWPNGRERYACGAIDALGMAPMLGETVDIARAVITVGS
jgi:hypothetical protein